MSKIFLRLIVESQDLTDLKNIEETTLQRLATWAPQLSQPSAPYWKLPGHYEISCELSPGTDAVHGEVSALEPAGWDRRTPDADASCVWNRFEGRCFVHPAVVWAELGFMPGYEPGEPRS